MGSPWKPPSPQGYLGRLQALGEMALSFGANMLLSSPFLIPALLRTRTLCAFQRSFKTFIMSFNPKNNLGAELLLQLMKGRGEPSHTESE